MRIHHLNCGSLCPLSHPVLNKFAPKLDVLNLVCHCLLIEGDDGLTLVDTGLGVEDVRKHERLKTNFAFNQFAKPKLDILETAFMQIIHRGFNPRDVRNIIVSHFDADHIGGIADFPEATIHVMKKEWYAAQRPEPIWRKRYHEILWKENKKIETYSPQGDLWHGLSRVQNLKGIDPSIHLVSLPGHTQGHAGVLIEDKLFFVGDSFLQETQLDGHTPLPIKIYNSAIHDDPKTAEKTLQTLRDLHHESPELEIFCSHDQKQFNRFSRD